MRPAGSRRVQREGVGLGGGHRTVLYHDRSPLHTNFLVKEERTDLNLFFSLPAAGACQLKLTLRNRAVTLAHITI